MIQICYSEMDGPMAPPAGWKQPDTPVMRLRGRTSSVREPV